MKSNLWGHCLLALAIASGLGACTTESTDSDDEPITDSGSGASGSGKPNGGNGGSGAGASTESGESICNDTADCDAGLTCEHSTLGPSGVCALNCSSNADCSGGATCVNGADAGFDSSCLQSCDSSADCGAGLGCFVLTDGSQVCLPNDWGSEPGGKGLGDSCGSDTDCTSGWCLAGWCTESCSPSNTGCWGDYDGKNEFGNYNWCVLNNSGDYICFPGCTGNSSVCTAYDGVSCKSATDADGASTNICSG